MLIPLSGPLIVIMFGAQRGWERQREWEDELPLTSTPLHFSNTICLYLLIFHSVSALSKVDIYLSTSIAVNNFTSYNDLKLCEVFR